MEFKAAIFFVFVTLFSLYSFSTFAQKASNSKYQIASMQYEQITQQYLQHLANFEWEASYAFLAEDIEMHLPDGDRGSRTSFQGLDAVKAHWETYQARSGNDRAVFTKFVHLPVNVKKQVENIDMPGVFNVCYFSAELGYGTETANVRMNWTFHFNADKKIDQILCYYDRTPIIEAANKNFLKSKVAGHELDEMVVQYITLKSNLPEDQLLETAHERADNFRKIPGLIQKYYVRSNEPGKYSGIYFWKSKADMIAFSKSELARTIPQAYQVVGAPSIVISDMLFQLRD